MHVNRIGNPVNYRRATHISLLAFSVLILTLLYRTIQDQKQDFSLVLLAVLAWFNWYVWGQRVFARMYGLLATGSNGRAIVVFGVLVTIYNAGNNIYDKCTTEDGAEVSRPECTRSVISNAFAAFGLVISSLTAGS